MLKGFKDFIMRGNVIELATGVIIGAAFTAIVTALTDNLRVAFSVTVLGLLIGAVAFGLSLARESMYGQDYSDLEYVASIMTGTPA